ncbi:MAG: cytochrome c [Acidobacteriota bacterium]
MNKLLRFAVLLAFAAPFVWAAPAQADGKEVFTKYKCAACHSIKSQNITKANDASAAPEEGDAGAKVEPPDLSDVGSKRDAAWIKDYILKKNDNEGRKHKKRWTGTDDELQAVATWLASLKK